MRRTIVLTLCVLGAVCGCQSDATTGSPAPHDDGQINVAVQSNTHSDYANLPTAVRCTPRDSDKPKFGPPPPGYVVITGEPVPDWDPSHIHRSLDPRSPSWYLLGPRPILHEVWSGHDDASGRVVSIAPHPTEPDTVYIASASGGIWKTTDGGLLWVPMTDELPILNHGAVALDPTNPEVVYAGTGEYTTESTGDGLFRSEDGGLTWERIATIWEVGATCSQIVVDPTNPDVIHVTSERGYIRSTDGGLSWIRRLPWSASDVAVNPVDPQIVYVGVHSKGIYRSVNGGQSFSKLNDGLPQDDVRRILIDVSPSDPDVVYAVIVNGISSLRGLYQSTDGGDSWSKKNNTPNFPYPQGWYDVFLGVHPTDPLRVFGGGVFPTYAPAGVIRSYDGGDSWLDISISEFGGQVHPDQHAIAWGADGAMWIGNDGGVWKSYNDGDSWINTNATLTVTQNYQIALHPTDPAQLLGGTQDNGTVGRTIDDIGWPQVVGGDGGFAAYDHAEPGRRYTTYVNLTVYRIEPDGTRTNISGPWGGDPRNFISPLVMDPVDSTRLYGGTNRLWRTDDADGEASWYAISGVQIADAGTLNAIAVAPSDPDVVYTGSSTGAVWVSTSPPDWTDRSAGLPDGEISDVCVDTHDPGRAYVAYYNTDGPRVLRSDTYGEGWVDVTGSLPDGVAGRALEVDWRFEPPHLYLGSGSGVYQSFDEGLTWTKDGADLPNVNIGDLKIDRLHWTITAGTYGRGAWRKALVYPTGDLDCDDVVTFQDINPFALALMSRDQYLAAYPECAYWNADINRDGKVDVYDVNAFVALLGAR
jgi:photosystem II stability/assembly factor-like uncharacterized protein